MSDIVDELVTGARRSGIDAHKSLQAQGFGEGEEHAWERAHPVGRVEWIGEWRLQLWNFSVGDASLKPEHRAALQEFAARHRIRAIAGLPIELTGQASSSGPERANLELSRERANVAAFTLLRAGIPPGGLTTRAAGETQSIDVGASGEAMARDRRVEVTITPPPRPPEEVDALLGLAEAGSSPAPRPLAAPYPVAVSLTFDLKLGWLPPEPGALTPVGWIAFKGVVTLGAVDMSGGSTKLSLSILEEKAKVAFEVKLGKSFAWEQAPDGIGLKARLGDQVLEAVDLSVSRDAFPISLGIKPVMPRWAAQEISSLPGVVLKVVAIKGTLGYRPHEQFMRRLGRWIAGVGARLAPWLRGSASMGGRASPLLLPAAYAAFVVWGLEEFAEAREEGRERAFFLNGRRGYASSLASLARGGQGGIESLHGATPFARQALVLGWHIGEQGWLELDKRDRALITAALEQTGAGIGAQTAGIILGWIGGANLVQPLPHPRELLSQARGVLAGASSKPDQ